MNEKVLDILTHGMIIVLKTEIDELFFVCFFASPLAKRGWGGIEPPTSRTLNENHTTRPPARIYGECGFRSRCLDVANVALYRLS